MGSDQVQMAVRALLGQMTDAQKASINPVLAALGQPQLAQEPVAVVEQPSESLTSQELLLVKLFREFANSGDDGKQLVGLLGKFQRFAQSSIDRPNA